MPPHHPSLPCGPPPITFVLVDTCISVQSCVKYLHAGDLGHLLPVFFLLPVTVFTCKAIVVVAIIAGGNVVLPLFSLFVKSSMGTVVQLCRGDDDIDECRASGSLGWMVATSSRLTPHNWWRVCKQIICVFALLPMGSQRHRNK